MSNIEHNILKHVLTSQKCALDFISSIDQPDKLFSKELWLFNKTVFTYIRSFRAIPTLRVITERVHKDTVNVITEIYNTVMLVQVQESEYAHDLELLKQQYKKRQLYDMKRILSDIDGDADNTLKQITNSIKLINAVDQDVICYQQNVKDYIPIYRDNFKSISSGDPNANQRIPLFFSVFDQATNGGMGVDADLCLVMGETGTGKSFSVMSMGKNVWMGFNALDSKEFLKGKNIVHISLEMPYKQVWNRFVAAVTDVDYFHIEKATFNKEELDKMKRGFSFIERYPYQYRIVDFYGQELSSDKLDQILDDIEQEFKPDLIIVDYLALMRENVKQTTADWERLDIITREFRALLRKRKISAISPWQMLPLDSSKYTPEHSIGLHRMNRNKGTAQHVTHVIQLVSRGPTKEGLYTDIEYAILKVREGFTAMGRMKKNFAKGAMLDDPTYTLNSVTFPDLPIEDFESLDKVIDILG
jgi:replicative DNA helicase